MNAYTLALGALLIAFVAQTFVAGLGLESYLQDQAPRRRAWLALTAAALLLALHHGYTLELALRTGLYDLRGALLAATAALCLVFAAIALRRTPA
ncbi:MAG: hypothetical protein LBE62_05580 [Azonexus sp.]|jgi:hypothetical protein|nr:hypothetical protein [Azonexus sp.]